MCFLLAYYLLISVICLWAGLLCYSIAGAREKNSRDARPAIVSMITGLVVLAAGAEWLALFFPLRPWGIAAIFLLLNLCAGRAAAGVFRNLAEQLRGIFSIRRSAWYFITCAGLLLLVLLFNAGPARMDDTESYHIQAIQWLQHYGTVPGIANLHLRFGFNSAWFSAIGLLTYSPPGFNGFFSLNGVICCWFCLYLLNRFTAALESGRIADRPGAAPGILLVLLVSLGNFYILRRSAAGTSYDFISTMSIVILFMECDGEAQPPLEWIIWPLFLFTVRLTSYPLLLLPLAFCVLRPAGIYRRPWRVAGITASLFVIPFIARNLLLSGYPFFPVTALGWWNPDWKVDARLAGLIRDYIRYFNRVNPMFESISITRQRGNWRWIGPWWKYLFTPDRITLLAGGAGYLLYFFLRPAAGRMHRLLITVICLSLIPWFFTAPDPRFVQGVFLCGLLCGAEALFRKSYVPRPALSLAFCMAGIVCFGYSIFVQRKAGTQTSVLLPKSLPVPPVRIVQVGDISLHIPERILGNWNPRCYDVDLPCLYVPDPRLVPRGKRLADGFRLDTTREQTGEPFSGEYIIK